MVESGQAKKSAAVNHTYLQAIVAYLNFEQEDFTFDMPLTFTPGKLEFKLNLDEPTINRHQKMSVPFKKHCHSSNCSMYSFINFDTRSS